jgi:oligosaccharide repeat unit polymerase
VPFVVIALLGTGQRAFLIYAFAALLFGLTLLTLNQRRSFSSRKMVLYAAPVLLLFSMLTAAYKGLDQSGYSGVAVSVLTRFFVTQQDGGIVGFRYIADSEAALFSEWLAALRGLLPGFEGSTLSHEIHGVMYGSTRGTVPLTLVGSSFHNGGMPGLVAVFALLGALYSHVYHRFLRGERTVLRCLSYGAIFFYLSSFVIGTPAVLANNGVLALLLLLALRKFQMKSSRTNGQTRRGGRQGKASAACR